MNTKYAIALLAGLASLQAVGQSYTLSQCDSLALENNRTIKARQMELQCAQQTRNEAFTSFFPKVDAAGFIFRANKSLIESTIALPVPGIPPLPLEMLDKGKTALVSAVQPVFAGGQIFYGNKLAKVGVEAQELMLALSEKEVKEKVAQHYWQIAAVKEKLVTINTVESLLKQVHSDVAAAVKAGIAPMNDQLRVELQQQEVTSNKLKAQNGLTIGKMALAQLVGVDMQTFDIANATFAEPDKPASIFIDPSQALPMRDEYKLLDKNILAAELRKKMEVGKHLPTVGVGASYVYHDFMGPNSNFGAVFATASIPISGWWGGSHAIKREKLKIKLSENEKQNISEQLILQINLEWHTLLEAYQQIELAKQSIASAKENMRLSYDYYKAGTVTLSDLLDAQQLFQQSNDRYTEAFASYQVQRQKYLRATGR